MLEKILDIALEAGKEVMKIYNSFEKFDVAFKEDGSPLTIADETSNNIITTGLKIISKYPIISEESEKIPYEERKKWRKFWLIDPLDGTKEFLKKMENLLLT